MDTPRRRESHTCRDVLSGPRRSEHDPSQPLTSRGSQETVKALAPQRRYVGEPLHHRSHLT